MIDQAKQDAVLKAIAVAGANGGGTVELPPGEYDGAIIAAAVKKAASPVAIKGATDDRS